MLAGSRIERIVSSPYLRCVQTVEPLARARGLEVEGVVELAEHQLTRRPAPSSPRCSTDGHAVACVHGGIERALGLDLRFKKGAVWRFVDALERPEILVLSG